MAVFGFSGAIDARVIAFALLIGVVALPGAFLARRWSRACRCTSTPRSSTWWCSIGGAVMIVGALMR